MKRQSIVHPGPLKKKGEIPFCNFSSIIKSNIYLFGYDWLFVSIHSWFVHDGWKERKKKGAVLSRRKG